LTTAVGRPYLDPIVMSRIPLTTLAFSLLGSLGAGAQELPPTPPDAPSTVTDENPPTPKLVIRGFGDVNFATQRKETPETFTLGELDLFMTSEVTDQVSVLAEAVFEPGGSGENFVDVERVQVKLALSDRFNLAFGRMHAVLGYWNQTYHHGVWFQTTALRPEIYLFEDEGGVLPVHEVGLQLFGTQRISGLNLDYNLSASNGRGRTTTDIEAVQDPNRTKAVNLWLGLRPKALPGLSLGGVVRLDKIPPDAAFVPPRPASLKERILGGFFAYQHSRYELLAEGFWMRHEDETLGQRYETSGGYAQASYRLGRWRPYYRFDFVDIAPDDPFLATRPSEEGHAAHGTTDAGLRYTESLRRHTFGVRVDPWAWAAVKAEASHNDLDGSVGYWGGLAQFCLTF